VTLAKPHGLVVETVVPEGPAARAGIEPGDHLGNQRDCPSTSLGLYRPHSQPRQVEVTVRRPASSTPHTPLAEESASGEASEE
jgi:S1-C subfamily serine protease